MGKKRWAKGIPGEGGTSRVTWEGLWVQWDQPWVLREG